MKSASLSTRRKVRVFTEALESVADPFGSLTPLCFGSRRRERKRQKLPHRIGHTLPEPRTCGTSSRRSSREGGEYPAPGTAGIRPRPCHGRRWSSRGQPRAGSSRSNTQREPCWRLLSSAILKGYTPECVAD